MLNNVIHLKPIVNKDRPNQFIKDSEFSSWLISYLPTGCRSYQKSEVSTYKICNKFKKLLLVSKEDKKKQIQRLFKRFIKNNPQYHISFKVEKYLINKPDNKEDQIIVYHTTRYIRLLKDDQIEEEFLKTDIEKHKSRFWYAIYKVDSNGNIKIQDKNSSNKMSMRNGLNNNKGQL